MRLPIARRRDEDDADLGYDEHDTLDGPVLDEEEAAPALSAALADSVRFPIAEPRGYFFPPVEEFVKQTQEALRFHEERDFQRRRRIYDLEQELALQVHDVQRLRTEIELFTVQGTPMVNPDGSYVTESQQADSGSPDPDAPARLTELTAQLRQSEEAYAAVVAELAALRAWADEVEVQFQGLHDQAAQKDALLAEMEQAMAALLAENESLRAGTAPVGATEEVPGLTDEAPEAGLADEGQPQPIPQVDSELPPGITPPGEAAPRHYPTATPGAPLSTVAGPVEQWAPELAAHPTDGV